MTDVAELLGKALLGGVLVVAFALLGEVLRPRWFSGLFGAAPAVALGGLAVVVLADGNAAAAHAAAGMVAGAIGFVVFALLVRLFLRRMRALPASLLALLAWGAIALCGYGVVLR